MQAEENRCKGPEAGTRFTVESITKEADTAAVSNLGRTSMG